ncbi:MAG TPA: HAD family hydrolase [Bryobacteraceae bacterium]|nr:HAD family hydrolase [Bryobacteraceae bacterium]
MRPAVFLDRDGVLNRPFIREGKPYPPPSLSDFRLLPGVREACRKLREAGFALILITNQPDIARGQASVTEIGEMHARLRRFLQLDDVRVCPHDDDARCGCRKPQPGLLIEAASACNIDLKSSFMVGDRWRDIEAGQRAGCKSIFVDRGYRERQPDGPYQRVHSLVEAANWIVRTVQMGALQYG